MGKKSKNVQKGKGEKKEFVSKTGLIGLGCGIIGFIFSFVYVILNGIVFTTYGPGIPKRDSDGAFAELKGNKYDCFYYDKNEICLFLL